MSVPEMRMAPDVGWISFIRVRPIVDFPQPLSPTRPNVSPASMWKLTSSTA